jgi:hypothetical protein
MSYNFKENLNMFEQAVCLKSTPLKDLSLSSISIFWKIVILFVLVWAIVTTAVNIAAYAKILNSPDDKQDLSSSWCIAMLIFNGCLLLVSLLLVIVVILSFKKESDAKKAVQMTVKGAEKIAAAEGAAVGTEAGLRTVAEPVATNIGNLVATTAVNNGVDLDTARNMGKSAFSSVINSMTNPNTINTAATAAINSASEAAESGTLDVVARGTLGRTLKPPTQIQGSFATATGITNNLGFAGGIDNSIFNSILNNSISSPGNKCSDDSSIPCGNEKDYAVNLYHDLVTSPNSRFTGSQFSQKVIPDLLSFNN